MEGKISGAQFFAIIFLCRITEFFTYITPRDTSVAPSDRIFVMMFFAVFCAVALFPALAAKKIGGNISVPALARNSSKPFGSVITVMYIAALVWAAADSVSRFELFISTVMFPDTDINLITAILLLAAAFAASKGTEAIGRSSVTITAVLAVSFVFILLTSISEFDPVNFSPILYDGISTAFRDGFAGASRSWEIIFFAIMLPHMRGSATKTAAAWLASFAAVALIGFFVIDGVTGKYGEQQMFKLYTLTVLAKIGILERFDDVLIGIWVLCELIKAAFCLLAASKAYEDGFGKRAPKFFYPAMSAIVFAVFAATAGSVGRFTAITDSVPVKIVFYACTVALPMSVLAVTVITKRKAASKLA